MTFGRVLLDSRILYGLLRLYQYLFPSHRYGRELVIQDGKE
jgi:hypothetical protein